MDDRGTRESINIDSTGLGSVKRAVDILALLNRDHMTLYVRNTSVMAGLPKTTALRPLQTLEQSGLLWGLSGGHYTSGSSPLQQAKSDDDTWLFPSDFNSVLSQIARRRQETANLYIRSGLHWLWIAQAPGPPSLKHVVMVGDELPLWVGASSKILLVAAPEEMACPALR